MYFKRIYKNDPLLDDFFTECSDRGFKNNTSISSTKFDYFEHSAFFAGIHNNKIKVFSGVHNFDYDGKRFWRILFRGVTLYDNTFKPLTSRNLRVSSINVGVCAVLQMRWVERHFVDPVFVMTSNDLLLSDDIAGRSHVVDRILKAKLVKGWTPLYQKINYLNTIQNVWLTDKDVWYRDFDLYYNGKIEIRDE